MAVKAMSQAQLPPPMAAIVDGEFREMPGLRLTPAQAQRLWHLSAEECTCVLEYLTRKGRLQRDRKGQYCVRRTRQGPA